MDGPLKPFLMDNKEITSDSVKAPFIAQLRALTANIPMAVSSTTQSLHVNNSDQGEWKLTQEDAIPSITNIAGTHTKGSV